MSAQNIVSLGFDIDRLTTEKKQVLDEFTDLFDKLNKYEGTKFDPLGAGGLNDLRKSIKDSAATMGEYQAQTAKYIQTVNDQVAKQQAARKSTDELTLATNEYKKTQDGIATTQAKVNAAGSDAAKTLAEQKLILSQVTAENKNAAKEALGLVSEYQKLEAQFKSASLAAKEVGATQGTSSEAYKEAAAKANELNNQLKAIDDGVGNFQRHVGNYASGFSGAFDVLKEELEGVNKQLAEMESKGAGVQNFGARTVIQGFGANQHQNQGPTALAGGAGATSSILDADSAAYQKLTLQQKIIEGSLERQRVGFSTVNQEMRSAKATLDALALAGAENTEGFEKLNLAYTAAGQKVKDLHQEQAILTSDAPALTALSGIAKGLGGAYALGAGASALFADGNEKLEKELNKLVAVMTFLQGLEEATRALKDRNALSTALEESATKALNYVKELEVKWFGKEKTVLQEDTIAKAVNTGATEANAEATAVNTTAVEGMTVANEEAAASTVELGTALLATGIGAIILVIGASVGFLVEHLIELSEAETKAAQRSAELAESTQKTNEILLEQIKLSDEAIESQQKNLENAIALAEKNKQSEKDLLKIRQDQADLDRKKAEDDLKKLAKTDDLGEAYNIVQGKIDAAAKSVVSLGKKQLELIDITKILTKVNGDTDGITQSEANYEIYSKYKRNLTKDEVKEQQDAIEKEKAATKKFLEDSKALIESYDKSNIDKTTVAVDEKQHSDEEVRKITLDTAIREANAIKAKNQLILNDDRSTLAQRLAAIKSNGEQEIKIAAATRDDALNKPGAISANGEKSADAIDAIRDFGQKQVEISASTQQKLYQTTVEYNDKRLAFLNDVLKNELNTDAVAQDAITKNLQNGLEERLLALQAGIADRAKVIAADFDLQQYLAIEHKKSQEERDKIESDRQTALAALTENTQKDIYDIVTSYGEKRIKAVEDQNKATNTSNAVTQIYNTQEDALNKSLINQTISYANYLRQKRKLDEDYILAKDRADVADDESDLNRIKEQLVKENQARLDAAKLQLDAAKGEGNDKDIAEAQAKVDALAAIQTKANAADVAATDKANKDKQKLNDDDAKKIKAAHEVLRQVEDKLEQASFNLAQQLVDSSYENEINHLQKQIEANDKLKASDDARIESSTLGEQEKANEIGIINKQADAENAVLQKKQRDEKVKEAKFDRDMAVAKVVWDTEAAIAKTFGEFGGTPIAFGIAAAMAALGVVEVATILAKPIPAYRMGTTNHPGGPAVVGDGLEKELIKEPGKQAYWSPAVPTTLTLRPHTQVLPLSRISEMMSMGMFVNNEGILAPQQIDNTADLREIKNVIGWLGGVVKESARANRVRIPRPGSIANDLAHAAFIRKNVLD